MTFRGLLLRLSRYQFTHTRRIKRYTRTKGEDAERRLIPTLLNKVGRLHGRWDYGNEPRFHVDVDFPKRLINRGDPFDDWAVSDGSTVDWNSKLELGL